MRNPESPTDYTNEDNQTPREWPSVPVDLYFAAHSVCKQIVEGERPGALATRCQAPPINGLGFCETHRPKGRD